MTLADASNFFRQLLVALSPIEAAAALLGAVYVVLAVRKSRGCWVFAFASTGLYLFVFADARLYMQAGLQVYFLAAAVYGWFAWRGTSVERPVTTGRPLSNFVALIGVVAVALITAQILARETHSQDPFMDALTTWASVFATALQARKLRENWLWWVGIDLVIAWLCLRQGLPLTALLYVLYVGLALLGWRAWRAEQAGP